MWSPVLVVAALVAGAEAHGRVLEPPSRASAWRAGFPTPRDYNDNGVNCGGKFVQHSTNGGRCGICGDAYHIPPPRPHELGGVYGRGVVVARYRAGASVATTVDLTASHRGYWQFKLCPDPAASDQACFDNHVLPTESGETKYYPTRGSTRYKVTYKLPPGLTCDHCVLQWRYTAGNDWGKCENGSFSLGCGDQEQFLACSDISIGMTRGGAHSDDITPLVSYSKNVQQGKHAAQLVKSINDKVKVLDLSNDLDAVQQVEEVDNALEFKLAVD